MKRTPSHSPRHAKPLLLLCLYLLLSPSLRSQDIHSSQIDINPVALNPAYNGFFDGSGRFGLAYRSQWSSVSKPYQTFLASGEFSLHRNRFHRSGLNLGLLLYLVLFYCHYN